MDNPEAKSVSISTIEEYDNLQNDKKKFNEIKELTFTHRFVDKINIFPSKLKTLIFLEDYENYPLPDLENTRIKHIEYCTWSSQVFKTLQYKYLKYLIFSYYNEPLPDLKDTNIKFLDLGLIYDQPLLLKESNVKYLVLGYAYNRPLDLEYTNIRSILFGGYDGEDIIISYYKNKIRNSTCLYNVSILARHFPLINKYNNQIFNITAKGKRREQYIIRKNLHPYIKYIIYNPVYIPFEIYNYIYLNYNFTYKN